MCEVRFQDQPQPESRYDKNPKYPVKETKQKLPAATWRTPTSNAGTCLPRALACLPAYQDTPHQVSPPLSTSRTDPRRRPERQSPAAGQRTTAHFFFPPSTSLLAIILIPLPVLYNDQQYDAAQ